MMVQNTNVLSILLLNFSVILVQVSSNSFVKVRGNDCMTVTDGGACIESVADSNNRYYNNFDCDMKVLGAGRLILHRFDTENYYDRLYINPTSNAVFYQNYSPYYDQGNGPSNVQVNQNDIIRFTTDGSVIRTGFTKG